MRRYFSYMVSHALTKVPSSIFRRCAMWMFLTCSVGIGWLAGHSIDRLSVPIHCSTCNYQDIAHMSWLERVYLKKLKNLFDSKSTSKVPNPKAAVLNSPAKLWWYTIGKSYIQDSVQVNFYYKSKLYIVFVRGREGKGVLLCEMP